MDATTAEPNDLAGFTLHPSIVIKTLWQMYTAKPIAIAHWARFASV